MTAVLWRERERFANCNRHRSFGRYAHYALPCCEDRDGTFNVASENMLVMFDMH